MIDLFSAASGANAAFQLANSILKMKVNSEVRAKTQELIDNLIELQGKVLAGQADYAEIASSKRELENEMMKIRNWEEEKQRYKLHRFPYGTITYVLKQERDDGEPPHYLCANCYQDSVKSILQRNPAMYGLHFLCPRCKVEISTGESAKDY